MRISDWSSDVCSSDLDLLIHLQRARCASKRRSAFLISASEFPRLRGQLPEQSAIVPLDLLAYGERRSILIPTVFRSEEHTSELQSLMRISYAVFCLNKKTLDNISKKQKSLSINNNKDH